MSLWNQAEISPSLIFPASWTITPAAAVREAVDAEISALQPVHLILDFKNVTFMDSSGIGLVMGRYRLMSAHRGSVEIRNVSPSTKKIMELAGLGRIAVINETKE